MSCFGLFSMIQGLFQTAFWILLVVGLVTFIRSRRGPRPDRRAIDPVTRSVSVLNGRYARGEIGRDEYLERKAFLE